MTKGRMAVAPRRVKKEQRRVYLELASAVDWAFCPFCKFAKGGYSPCDVGEPECKHPLADRLEEQWGSYMQGIEPGDDCWGFRPEYDASFCADLIGLMLANRWKSCSWWKNRKGQWKVREAKY